MSTLVNLQYGYDRASNRKHRLDEAATANSQHFDERYGYDGLNRLTAFDRGQLDVNGDNLTNATLGQTWNLDPTGNWNAFAQTVTGAFSTTRTHTEANEIEGIVTPTGSPTWATPPDYDDNGNMTEFPQPGSLGNSYVATYDAWNRLVKLENGGTVAEYEYDGLNRRTTKTVASETRHAYFSDRWQVLEERVDSSTDPERQFLWGERYVDDLVLRDRDTDGNGTLDERLYALSDALFNVAALTDDTGDVKERFAYQPYGKSKPLNPNFTTYSGTNYEWEYRFTGRELDLESGLQLNRMRYLHLELGRWLTRDPIGYEGQDSNLYRYTSRNPVLAIDSKGLKAQIAPPLRGYPECTKEQKDELLALVTNVCSWLSAEKPSPGQPDPKCIGPNLRDCLKKVCSEDIYISCNPKCASGSTCAQANFIDPDRRHGSRHLDMKKGCRPTEAPPPFKRHILFCWTNYSGGGFGTGKPCGSTKPGTVLHELIHHCSEHHAYDRPISGSGAPEACERKCFGGVDEEWQRFKDTPPDCSCDCEKK